MSTVDLDIERLRAETPGCERVVHLNNAGAALMPRPVLDAVIDHLRLEAMIGGYEAASAAASSIEDVYDQIARLLNCGREEIAVVESATRAWQLAFHAFRFSPGDRILTNEAEYASNLIAYLQVVQATGASVEVIPSDEWGETSLTGLLDMLDERVRLISITHVPTNGGLVNPAAGVGRIARAAGIPFLLDACQSVGQFPLDVDALGCDLLTSTGRKFLRGPRGTGFLYVRRPLLERLVPPMLDLHSATLTGATTFKVRDDARRFEQWEVNYAAKLGLGAAVRYANQVGLEAVEARVSQLARDLRARLETIQGVVVRDLGRRPGAIVTFTVDGVQAHTVQQWLARKHINVSVSEPEHTPLDAERRQLPPLVRASVHYYTTEVELEQCVAAVAEGLGLGRLPSA